MKAPLVMALLLCATASAQTMDVHVNQTGAFNPTPGGGIFTGVVDVRTTVQFPEGQNTVVIGGRNGATSRNGSQNGRTSTSSEGGSGYTAITVTPVPVITGPESRTLVGVPGRELLNLLSSPDPSDRLSAVAEIARRPWSPKARRVLTRNVSTRLADEAPRVAGAAASCLARLGDPEGSALLVANLVGRDPTRLVPMLEALGQIGDAACQKPVQKLADHIDLSISLAAGRALIALDRRLAREVGARGSR